MNTKPWLAKSLAAIAILVSCALLTAADDDGKIMRPADNSSFNNGAIDVIASAESGKLTLDGTPVQAEEPFRNVFHAILKAGPGPHVLALTWDGGKKEVHFFVGADAPSGFQAFRQHPPVSDVQCSQCHGLNQRGRFVFKGGCFDCHQKGQFAKVHTHEPTVLERCGTCHNAHGSTVKAHMLYPKETACKICHN